MNVTACAKADLFVRIRLHSQKGHNIIIKVPCVVEPDRQHVKEVKNITNGESLTYCIFNYSGSKNVISRLH